MAQPQQNYLVIPGIGAPIKAWIKGVSIEEEAKLQLQNVAQMPFIHKHLAVMPDVHWGMGATIGSVICSAGAIIPAAVGVDIGCGMMALQTSLKAKDLPESLAKIRTQIEQAVPHGRTNHGAKGDKGAWQEIPLAQQEVWKELLPAYNQILKKHPKIAKNNINALNHLGTLGTGNHFIEICLDENQNVWVMLHSGSRGVGNKIGTYFIELAKEDMRRHFIKNLPDENLAYLCEGLEFFKDYVNAVEWAQNFAKLNREFMMQAVLKTLRDCQEIPPFQILDQAINCHHNYVSREHHFGKNVWVTRKGAVRARVTDLGIIPGSMGARSYIVKGLGNPESFHSCSHGAGRAMSRNAAKKRFTLKDHRLATEGVECRQDEEVIDETPAAYKNIEKVMAAQSDLVEILYTLKQVLCVKG